MNKIITLLILGSQITLAFITTFCIYMLFAFLDNDLGFDGLFGLFFIQPLIASAVSALTIMTCLVAGLPIRLNSRLNHWWTARFYVPLTGTICGLTLLLLALLPYFRETATAMTDGQESLKQVANPVLLGTGWLLTAFSLLHTYPTRKLTQKAGSVVQQVFGASLALLASLVLANCSNPAGRTEKSPLLRADREAPLGWVYLAIYEDSTFEFTLSGIRADQDVFRGKVEIGRDSLFFTYADSIPRAGKTAVYNDKVVAYIDGEYPERLNISMTKLKK